MIRKATLAASAIVLSLGMTTTADAGGGHRGQLRFGGHHGGGHFSGRSHFRGGGHHGHGGGYALLGFGLGVLMYSAVTSSHRSNYYYGGGRSPYYGPVYRAYPAPAYGNPNYYNGPAPQTAPSQPTQWAQEFPPGTTCLQTREYQTVITIGGEEQEAYGTACLQPDGSWLAGAPKLVSLD